ncbi:hypothetical protein GCM10027052_13360 [Parafrigoribacterium mesophilum]|uniref:hypothetical protein n=1 Tax=Parafrigoribacterium mesophilum TaxID=433646 RepID=UPI0031FC416E
MTPSPSTSDARNAEDVIRFHTSGAGAVEFVTLESTPRPNRRHVGRFPGNTGRTKWTS